MTKEDFVSLLDQKPDDWDLRLVYADWLEEHVQSQCCECSKCLWT